MKYQVLSGPFNAGKRESDLNGHAAEGWRVAGTFQAISPSSNKRRPFATSCSKRAASTSSGPISRA